MSVRTDLIKSGALRPVSLPTQPVVKHPTSRVNAILARRATFRTQK